jgi:ABC-2 type transport system permease protein
VELLKARRSRLPWVTFCAFTLVAVLFGLIVVWLFGREFSQDTAKDLLALPTARSTA